MSQTQNLAHPHMKHKPTTTKETDEIIKSLKVKDSHGYDEISTKILKISSTFIISPLNYICNKVLFKGIYPDRLKFSVIKPLYKKGNKQDTSNYRPISLLTSFSKIFEKVMLNRLLVHLTKYSTLSYEQYGFRTKLTTENAAYKLTNEILNAMYNK
jgi:Notch-like protein